ncbi:hypothetical protein FOZ62_015737, partial [Perkinsus olseni]
AAALHQGTSAQGVFNLTGFNSTSVAPAPFGADQAALAVPPPRPISPLDPFGTQPDEHDIVEMINENGTDPISVRNLEPGESCNDDCLHAKFEALERMQLRLNSSLEPVADRGFLHEASSREKLTDFKGR